MKIWDVFAFEGKKMKIFSKMFMFLPSILDRKETIPQWQKKG